jgi:hypothetical protein
MDRPRFATVPITRAYLKGSVFHYRAFLGRFGSQVGYISLGQLSVLFHQLSSVRFLDLCRVR